MYFKKIVFTVFILVVVMMSCTKEQPAVFTIPSTYRFNSPNLDLKQVFVIDVDARTFRAVSDTLGTFNRPNSEIADSFNRIIRNEFVEKMIVEVTFNTSDQATIQFGKLDTSGVIPVIIPENAVNSKYSLLGNQVVFNAFPEYNFNINNSFLELNFCQEFTLRSYKTATGVSEKRYFKRLCVDGIPRNIVNNIVTSNPSVRYDTISVEIVNYIFSKY